MATWLLVLEKKAEPSMKQSNLKQSNLKQGIVRWLLVVGVLVLGGCGPTNQPSADGVSGQLTITGSSTVAPLVAEMAMRFEQKYPKVRIDVQTGGSGKGIADARNGIADIGMASRDLKPSEADLQSYKIAADGVSLIVHDSNGVQALSDQQIVEIYTGKIDNWRQVGAADQQITVVHKAEGRATLEVFLEYFNLQNPSVQADVIVGDNQHGIKTVAGVKGAIGYVSIGTAEAEIESGTPVRLLAVGGVAATSESVAAGEFPICRPLNLVMLDLTNPLVKSFVEFCKSEEVHDQVVAQYFVPIKK